MAKAASVAIPAIIVGGREARHLRVPKQSLPFGDTTVLGKTVRAYVEAGASEVIVVLGYKSEQVLASLGPLHPSVKIVRNPLYEEGMGTFLRAGVRELPQGAKAFTVGLCDQPLLSAELIREFVEAFFKAGKKILVPVLQTSLGLPIVCDASVAQEIQALPPNGELWDVIKRSGDDLFDYPTGYTAVLRSIEDLDDYHDMLRVAGLKIPEIPMGTATQGEEHPPATPADSPSA
jgi:CTP:molybdopterin cytidylyltransferase MocA